MAKTALIVGATGLVGRELLKMLLKKGNYDKVVAIVRRPLKIADQKLTEIVTDFDKLDESVIDFHVDDVFSCIGTTIKKAQSKDVMYRIDVTYPLRVAKLSRKAGAKKLLFVSAMGANAKSSIFYTRIKGELEGEVQKLGYDSIAIFRPSLLLGERAEFRFGEKTAEVMFRALSFLFVGPLRKVKGIEAKTIALAMYDVAQAEEKGIAIYQNDEIEKIGSLSINNA
ncbi:oxidoreductase [Halalkalibacter sp. APA_J-10(15)]|uniref:oxidoreductase n=1 Tax=Halalkalibacter sp. APA_J-10(15) TaxID=2933805 RepID=UPI001FF61750|nr:oxidoreductase [Halalkalibacter sp. APA_J-10(15)]MCK0472240.1 oxidoreductase [Halalkalibacter sp. APA_J-10(15)]